MGEEGGDEDTRAFVLLLRLDEASANNYVLAGGDVLECDQSGRLEYYELNK